MKLTQLHRSHVSGEERLPQLQSRNGVLLKRQKRYLDTHNILRINASISQLKALCSLHGLSRELFLYKQNNLSLLALSFKHLFMLYLNDVATKRSPQALLFRIVELIIGEVPGILHFRL